MGSACSGISSLMRFQNTAEIRGISPGSTASFSMIEASVSSRWKLRSRARAVVRTSGETRSRIRATIRARISSGVIPFTNW